MVTAAAAASIAMDAGTIADIGNGGMLSLKDLRGDRSKVVVANPVSSIMRLYSVDCMVHL